MAWRTPALILVNRNSDGPTFFRSADRGLHLLAKLRRDSTKHEARKRRASERPRVGCCEELAVMYQDVVP